MRFTLDCIDPDSTLQDHIEAVEQLFYQFMQNDGFTPTWFDKRVYMLRAVNHAQDHGRISARIHNIWSMDVCRRYPVPEHVDRAFPATLPPPAGLRESWWDAAAEQTFDAQAQYAAQARNSYEQNRVLMRQFLTQDAGATLHTAGLSGAPSGRTADIVILDDLVRDQTLMDQLMAPDAPSRWTRTEPDDDEPAF